jgi:glycogen operon protein
VRKRQIKNFLLTLLISRGVPMLLGGDEVRRTQGGNNNAYCQDNATSWFNWAQVGENREIHRFARDLIAFRATHPVLSKEEFYSDAEIQWLGPTGEVPRWTDPKEKQLGCLIAEDGEAVLLMMFNGGTQDTEFMFPSPLPQSNWQMVFDTARVASKDEAPDDNDKPSNRLNSYVLRARSSAIWVRTPH